MLDKAGYVDRYPAGRSAATAARCRRAGVEVDESSGSSGRPYQWVRSRAELDQVERGLAVQAGWLLRERAGTTGSWCSTASRWAPGRPGVGDRARCAGWARSSPAARTPDKALAAIELLGPDACYVVCGYPPFLATLPRRRRGQRAGPVRSRAVGFRRRRGDDRGAARPVAADLRPGAVGLRGVRPGHRGGRRDRVRGGVAAGGGRRPGPGPGAVRPDRPAADGLPVRPVDLPRRASTASWS